MVRHDDGHVQSILSFVIVQATSQGDIACPGGKGPAELTDEGNEVRFVVTLQMRQVPTVEGHGRVILSQGTEVSLEL